MFRYVKLYISFMRICLIRELEARGNFVADCLIVLCYPIFPLLLVGAIYTKTGSLGGWTFYEYLILVGSFQLVTGIVQMAFFKNLYQFTEYVRKGELDFFLLKPINSQFMISTRYVSFTELGHILPGIAMLIIGLSNLNVTIDWWRWPIYFLFIMSGVMIAYAMWFIMMIPSIWLIRFEAEGLFFAVFDIARYHPNFFGGFVKTTVIYILPVGVIAATPADLLLNRLSWEMGLWTSVVCVGLLLTSSWLWRLAQTRYYGASS